jgi:hypothetical protein
MTYWLPFDDLYATGLQQDLKLFDFISFLFEGIVKPESAWHVIMRPFENL